MKLSDDLILKINEIYHDVEGNSYFHPDIIKYESFRWKKIGKI